MFLNENIQANLYKLTDVLPKQLETKKCRCEHHQHPNELIVGPSKAHLSIAPACSLPFNLQMTVSPNAVLPSIKLGHEYTRGAEERLPPAAQRAPITGPFFAHALSCRAARGRGPRGRSRTAHAGRARAPNVSFLIHRHQTSFLAPNTNLLPLPGPPPRPSKLSFRGARCRLSELASNRRAALPRIPRTREPPAGPSPPGDRRSHIQRSGRLGAERGPGIVSAPPGSAGSAAELAGSPPGPGARREPSGSAGRSCPSAERQWRAGAAQPRGSARGHGELLLPAV